jgi:hypothetical protein
MPAVRFAMSDPVPLGGGITTSSVAVSTLTEKTNNTETYRILLNNEHIFVPLKK